MFRRVAIRLWLILVLIIHVISSVYVAVNNLLGRVVFGERTLLAIIIFTIIVVFLFDSG